MARANNLGQILKSKGDLEGAQKQTLRALRMHDHPNVAIDANNLGQIVKAKGDLEGAQEQTERALRIDEKDHPLWPRERDGRPSGWTAAADTPKPSSG